MSETKYKVVFAGVTIGTWPPDDPTKEMCIGASRCSRCGEGYCHDGYSLTKLCKCDFPANEEAKNLKKSDAAVHGFRRGLEALKD